MKATLMKQAHSTEIRSAQGGMTLLEVLIALLVLSFGILGHAGLQAAALKANHGAMVRSQATGLAYNILDRMRANQIAALQGAGAYKTDFSVTHSGTTVALQDLAAWKARLANALPAGDGQICLRNDALAFDCQDSGNFVVVSVRWTETDASNQERVQDGALIQIVGQL